jgi:hypothetical protein
MRERHSLFIFLIILLIFAIPCELYSQENNTGRKLYTFEFTGEPLASALELIVGETDADLIYDPNIVEGIHIYERITSKPVNEILTQILRNSGLDYIILSSGTYVIVRSSMIASKYGSITGKISDAETGEPLPGAHIMLADASGGTSSNTTGHFNLNRMLTGEYEIIFSYLGYEPIRKKITILPDSDVRESIRLNPKQIDVNPIVVSAHRTLLPSGHIAEESVEPNSEWNTGGRSYDAIQSLNLFSGIQYGLPLTDMHLQGSRHGDHRIYLDNTPVYNPYSFGRLFSAFSPYSINRVTVEKAGFDVSSGSQIAGKINLNHDISNRNGENALLQIDPVNTNIRVNFSIPNSDDDQRFQFMTAFRSSFWNFYKDPTLSGTLSQWDTVDPITYNILLNNDGERIFQSENNESGISYYDLHIASRYEIDPYRKLSYSFYSGRNTVQTDLLAVDDQPDGNVYMFSRDSYKWNNLATQISYDWLTSPRLDIRLQTSFSSNELNHSYSMIDNETIQSTAGNLSQDALYAHLAANIDQGAEQLDNNQIRHFISRIDANYTFSPQFSINSGLQFDRVESRFNLTDFFYLPTISNYSSHFYSSYIKGNWVLGNDLKFTAGSRFSFLSPSGSFYPEPRFSIQYDRSESALGYWSLKLSGGIYRQFINQFEISSVGPSSLVPNFTIWSHDSSIEQPKAYHTNLSFLVEPSDATSINIDSYLKLNPISYITSYRNLMVGNEINRDGFDSFAEITDMYSYGIGVRIQQSFLQSRLKLLLGYDFSISGINMETQFGRVVPSPWNEPHRIKARLIGRLSGNISVTAKWQSIYGRSWAFRQAYYDFLLPHSIPAPGRYNFSNPEDDQLKPFHQVDISLIYTPDLGSLSIETRLDLINILNRRNTIDWNLFPVNTSSNGGQEYEIRERTLPGFNPSFSLKINF